VYAAHFHELKENFVRAAGAMLRFAGIDGVDLVRLEQDVAVERLREEMRDKAGAHFRKGAIGDYKSIITSAHTIDDIDALVRANRDREGIASPVAVSLGSFRRSPRKPALVQNFAYGVARRPVMWARGFL
jgi:hypothetical protein